MLAERVCPHCGGGKPVVNPRKVTPLGDMVILSFKQESAQDAGLLNKWVLPDAAPTGAKLEAWEENGWVCVGFRSVKDESRGTEAQPVEAGKPVQRMKLEELQEKAAMLGIAYEESWTRTKLIEEIRAKEAAPGN